MLRFDVKCHLYAELCAKDGNFTKQQHWPTGICTLSISISRLLNKNNYKTSHMFCVKRTFAVIPAANS